VMKRKVLKQCGEFSWVFPCDVLFIVSDSSGCSDGEKHIDGM